jgi:hypothetical protein
VNLLFGGITIMKNLIHYWLSKTAALTIAISIQTLSAHAHYNMDWIPEHLEAFESNAFEYSKNYYFPMKHNPQDGTLVQSKDLIHFFTPEQIEDKSYVSHKDFFQKSAIKHRKELDESGRAPILSNDLAARIVDGALITRIDDMDAYLAGQVETAPWSSDYWAIYKGVAAARYANPYFPRSTNWKENIDFILSTQAEVIASNMDDLSPSEKYDLIVGDKNFSLTKTMLNTGRQYADSSGNVEIWMGICHGWAAAAFAVARPSQRIEVPTPSGHTIRLYPDDLKALISLLWANGEFSQKFISGRCNIKNPKTDPKTGRVLPQECFDTNPGTWHEVVVNQVGVQQSSLVLDATFDYEVWNQPIHSYEYVYFNPKTKQTTKRWQDAIVERTSFNDPFDQWRDKKHGKYLIGVAMKLVYVAETKPTHEHVTDNPSNDRLLGVNYLYDLELDSARRILGGEWYHKAHPDFLWAPTKNINPSTGKPQYARALSGFEQHLRGSWNGQTTIPKTWTPVAIAAAQNGTPLANVIEALTAQAVIASH